MSTDAKNWVARLNSMGDIKEVICVDEQTNCQLLNNK